MDIGPNIYARGQDLAKTLGTDHFSKAENISLMIDGAPQKLRYLGYSNKPKPKFMYKQGEEKISIESFMGSEGLVLNYIIELSKSSNVQLKLPKSLNVKTTDGKREGEIFTPANSNSFQIIIPVKENK